MGQSDPVQHAILSSPSDSSTRVGQGLRRRIGEYTAEGGRFLYGDGSSPVSRGRTWLVYSDNKCIAGEVHRENLAPRVSPPDLG
jgi:hypothetical protein